MNITVERPTPERIVATLREGTVETATVSAWHAERAALALVTAIDLAAREGYGECFWPEPNGQYWWLYKREERRLALAILWSSGPETGWQHVCRAADEVEYFVERVKDELAAHDLLPG